MRSPLRILTIGLLAGALAPAQEEQKKDSPPDPMPVEREASVTIDGELIDYRVTSAKLVLKKDDGTPRASIFHISYERTGIRNASQRPVVFAFNGGPGSSAVWLHLGALGPRLVPSTPDGTSVLPPPQRVRPNPHSILDVADLVFIDPVSTGYSRADKEAKPSEFHGLEGDIESVSDFIRRWITEHRRWGSPKFLLGESYGGIRAAGVAHHLQQRYGMNLNGVVLLSSLLDFRTLRPAQGDDLYYTTFLSAFTATAHHHGRLKGDREKLLADARKFAAGEYTVALRRGNSLPRAEQTRIARRLSELTGIAPAIILEENLRLSATRFRKELLRDRGLVLGRFDARVAWPAYDRSSDYPAYDPSYSTVYGAFSTAMLDYLSGELGWKEESPYEILTGKVRPWDYGADNSSVNMSGRLQAAMRDNPNLRVLVQCGQTDLATAPGAIEYSVEHFFNLPVERMDDIEFAYYEAGHMFYLNEPDLAKMRRDLLGFLADE